jgi:hypothetical protein
LGFGFLPKERERMAARAVLGCGTLFAAAGTKRPSFNVFL